MNISPKIIEETHKLTKIPFALERKSDRIETIPALEYPKETWLISNGSISNGCSAYSNWYMWYDNILYLWDSNSDKWV